MRGEIDVSGLPGFESGPSGRGIHVPAPREEIEFNPDAASDSNSGGLLVFRNGDQLSGRFESVAERGVSWTSVHSSLPITFSLQTETLSRLQLRSDPTPETPYSYRVFLTNGDVLSVSGLGYRDGLLSLETASAGMLRVARKHLLRIENAPGEDVLYSGPDGLDGWTPQSARMGGRYQEGGFHLINGGSLAHEFDFPSKGLVEFQVSAKGVVKLNVSLLGSHLKRPVLGGYLLEFHSEKVNLRRYSKSLGRKRESLGTKEELPYGEQGEHQFGIYFDEEEGTIGFMLNGELMKEWEEEGKLGKEGGVILFQTQGNSPVVISGIRVAKWNGQYPTRRGIPEEDDMARLANGDVVGGEIVAIDRSRALFKTADGEREVPMDQVEEIVFAPITEEAFTSGSRSVVASLGKDGQITLDVRTMDERSLKGESQVFGTLEIKADAVRSLQWKP